MADQASGKYRTTFGIEAMIYMCKHCGLIFKLLLQDENDCPRCGAYEADDEKDVKPGASQSPDKSLDQGEVK